MKELWCDFDGVIVPKIADINTAGISSEEFADIVKTAYQCKPFVSPAIRDLISRYNNDNGRVYIITGRKKSYLSEITEKVLEDHNILVDGIYYYPEKNRYVMEEYYAWKASVIKSTFKNDPEKSVRVIDDDRGLLTYVKQELQCTNLSLICYEIFPDGMEKTKQI